jgi:hypothetical protein
MSLAFDHETHTYKIDGAVVPSVTQVIGAVMPGWCASGWHMGRGAAVHHGCRLLDQGRLDWSSVDPEIEPRIKAWQQFRKDSPMDIEMNETPMSSLAYRYAGTVDRVFTRNVGPLVLDLKSTVEPQVIPQLGAYSLLYTERTKKAATGAAAVELRDDGTYSAFWLTKFELHRAAQTFLGCLTVYNFMQAHNLKGNSDGR